jgi:hypothetical protein
MASEQVGRRKWLTAMDYELAFERLEIRAVDIFREAFTIQFYGNHLFDMLEQGYYRFSRDETGNSVWLVQNETEDRPYEIFQAAEEQKFTRPVVPALVSFSHCEPIGRSLLEDRRLEDIKRRIKRGGELLAHKANKAIIHVLRASIADGTSIPTEARSLDETMAAAFSDSTKRGFPPDKFVFPEHLKARLVQQRLISPDNEIRNAHYVGKTITGQDAFWSRELPEGTALMFASCAGVTLAGEPRFDVLPHRPFTTAVCGHLYLNPIVKDVQAVIELNAVDRALAHGAVPERPIARLQPENLYVNSDRIDELRAIKSSSFDLTKLVRLCEELNLCYASESFLAVPMVTRAILDHVPPILGFKTFRQIVNNYTGGSFRGSMQNLENSLRPIADSFLHIPTRDKETLPNRTQIDFRSDLDVLLQEIVRVLK